MCTLCTIYLMTDQPLSPCRTMTKSAGLAPSCIIRARRQGFHPEAKAIPCVSATGKRLDTVLEDLARRYQVLVVDTGAEDSVEMRATAAVADVFTIPVQAEQFDFWALATMGKFFSVRQHLIRSCAAKSSSTGSPTKPSIRQSATRPHS